MVAYLEEVAGEICERVAAGEFLVDICAEQGMPSVAEVSGWAVRDEEGFFGRYMRAKQMRCLRYADEIESIADEAGADLKTVSKAGREERVVDKECIQRSQIRIETRKWLMAKLLPRIFGDRAKAETGESKRLATPEEAAQAIRKRLLEAQTEESGGDETGERHVREEAALAEAFESGGV